MAIEEPADHTGAKGKWSYSCDCLWCRWQQFWNEDDELICPMPGQPHPLYPHTAEMVALHDPEDARDGG